MSNQSTPPSWAPYFGALATEYLSLIVSLGFLAARIGDGCGDGDVCNSDAAVFILLGVAIASAVAAFVLAEPPTRAATRPVAATWWSCGSIVAPVIVAGLLLTLQAEPSPGSVIVGVVILGLAILPARARLIDLRKREIAPSAGHRFPVVGAILIAVLIYGGLNALAGKRADEGWDKVQAQRDPSIVSAYSTLPYAQVIRTLNRVDLTQTNGAYNYSGPNGGGVSRLIDMTTKKWQDSPNEAGAKWTIKADYLDKGTRALVDVTDGSSDFLFNYRMKGVEQLESDLYCHGPLCGLIAPTYNGYLLETSQDQECKTLAANPELWCHANGSGADPAAIALPAELRKRLAAIKG